MDEDEARALARLISAAAGCPGGDPGQVGSAAPTLLSVPEAAGLTGHPDSTIRAWVCRKGPQRNPFPRPVPGSSGDRMRFDQLEVEAWMAEQTKLSAQRRIQP
jgi:predicted DNA-binding transcriptional regulator AlpA